MRLQLVTFTGRASALIAAAVARRRCTAPERVERADRRDDTASLREWLPPLTNEAALHVGWFVAQELGPSADREQFRQRYEEMALEVRRLEFRAARRLRADAERRPPRGR